MTDLEKRKLLMSKLTLDHLIEYLENRRGWWPFYNYWKCSECLWSEVLRHDGYVNVNVSYYDVAADGLIVPLEAALDWLSYQGRDYFHTYRNALKLAYALRKERLEQQAAWARRQKGVLSLIKR